MFDSLENRKRQPANSRWLTAGAGLAVGLALGLATHLLPTPEATEPAVAAATATPTAPEPTATELIADTPIPVVTSSAPTPTPRTIARTPRRKNKKRRARRVPKQKSTPTPDATTTPVVLSEARPLPTPPVLPIKPIGLYTPAAAAPKGATERGDVRLLVTMNEKGQVTNSRYVAGPETLAVAAQTTVKRWLFKPYVHLGEPIAVRFEVQVPFAGQPTASR